MARNEVMDQFEFLGYVVRPMHPVHKGRNISTMVSLLTYIMTLAELEEQPKIIWVDAVCWHNLCNDYTKLHKLTNCR